MPKHAYGVSKEWHRVPCRSPFGDGKGAFVFDVPLDTGQLRSPVGATCPGTVGLQEALLVVRLSPAAVVPWLAEVFVP
jgi:hypothetical protein